MINDKFHDDLKLAEKLAYAPTGIKIDSIEMELEGQEYAATRLNISDKKAHFRVAKQTPKKVGFFVAIWKREDGITKPYNIHDECDFFIISVRKDDSFGHFILNKEMLLKHNLISSECTTGKRGFRLYPPWVKVSNKQAERSQKWQCEYFIYFNSPEPLKYPELTSMLSY